MINGNKQNYNNKFKKLNKNLFNNYKLINNCKTKINKIKKLSNNNNTKLTNFKKLKKNQIIKYCSKINKIHNYNHNWKNIIQIMKIIKFILIKI